MICLEIKTSQGRSWKVGVDGGVVSASVHLLQLPGTPPYNPRIPETSPVFLSISGFGPRQEALHGGEVTMAVEIGQSLSIRVIEAAEADAPTLTPMLPDLPDERA